MELKAKAGKTVTPAGRGRGRGRGRPPTMGSPKDLSGTMIGTMAVIKTENDGTVGPAFSPQALSGTGRKSYSGSIGRGI